MSQLAQRAGVVSGLAAALDRTWSSERFDPNVPTAIWQAALCEPLSEFVRRPSKELRTMLCELGWALARGVGAMPSAVSRVIDGLHTGSLIVDDIEDGAVERRGAPAFHVLHGEATAINSGTWLYFWALDQLAELGGSPAVQLAMVRRTIQVLLACHDGQALDLRARVDQVDASKLAAVCAAITRGKTARLAALAMELAAMAAGVDDATATSIAALGDNVGTALQMLDDLGSLGRVRRTKGHEDLRGRRVTWPWAWLPEVTDAVTVARLQQRARRAAHDRGDDVDALADVLREHVEAHGRRRIRSHVDAGIAAARAVHGDSVALDGVAALLTRMEQSYD
jgi:geranylgeranyl pyrophosphate synthase